MTTTKTDTQTVLGALLYARDEFWDNNLRKQHDCVVEALPAAQRLVDGWLPIESAPRDGAFILTWHKNGGRPDISRFINGAWTRWAIEPTHWMPMPTPPTTSEEA
jgi:hypothetical protein